MQAYQTAPCPYCGATWNPPGAQTCANCHNQLPPPQPAYTPPGYAPPQAPEPQTGGAPTYDPNAAYPAQPQYGQPPAPGYPQPEYGQAPAQPTYGQQPAQPEYTQGQAPGYPPPDWSQQQPGYGYPPADQQSAYPPAAYPGYPQQGTYPGYPPPNYQTPGYPQQPAAPSVGQTIKVFGQPFTLPFALPFAIPDVAAPRMRLPRVRMRISLAPLKPLVFIGAAIAVVWVFLNFAAPVLADANLKAATQAVAAAASHQAATDAAVSAAFSINGLKDPMLDAAGAQTAMEARIASTQKALDQVRADEEAINTVDQHLALLAPVSGARSASIASSRQRVHTASVALQKVDQVLTGFVDQQRQLDQIISSIVVWKAMMADLAKKDPATAVSRYADASQKLQSALAASSASSIPPQSVAYTKSFQTLLDNTENLAQATQNKDNAGIAKYNAAVQAGVRAQAYDNNGELAWNLKLFQPLLDAYHAGIRALSS